MTSRLKRSSGPAALVLAMIALLVALTGVGSAVTIGGGGGKKKAPAKAKAGRVVRLGKGGKVPAKVLPKVPRARRADRLGTQSAQDLTGKCAATTVDLGSWCLQASPYPVPTEDTGKNDWFYATKACVEEGGWLPTAAQLVGAAGRVKLASTIGDSPLSASVDQDATDGLKDRREMSATLITTQAGSSAAGSQGVSDGAKGDPKAGEPDPVPVPANPSPETLQYVTVYDNEDAGGFAGARAVGQPENFRCGFDKQQGTLAEDG